MQKKSMLFRLEANKSLVSSIGLIVILTMAGIAGLTSCKIDDFNELDAPGELSRAFLTTSMIDSSSSELGGTASFNIKLALQPSADVVITLESDDEGEGVPVTTAVTFTPDNWNNNQLITVNGVNDDEMDSNQEYAINFTSIKSADPYFNNISVPAVTLTNIDDEARIDSLKKSSFTLLRTGGVCPIGFDDGWIQMDSEDDDNNSSLSGATGDTQRTNNTLTLRMCSTTSAGDANYDSMKNQSFVVLRAGGSCPTGYGAGTVKFDAEDDANKNASWGKTGDSYVTSDFVTLYTCDSSGDATLNGLSDSPFAVFKNGNCPAGSTEGTLRVDTEDDDNADLKSGSIGSSYLSDAHTKSVYLIVCTF